MLAPARASVSEVALKTTLPVSCCCACELKTTARQRVIKLFFNEFFLGYTLSDDGKT